MKMRLHHAWSNGDMDVITDHVTREHHPVVHVFTDAELRARDERIALAALRRAGLFQESQPTPLAYDAIIAAAEADQ